MPSSSRYSRSRVSGSSARVTDTFPCHRSTAPSVPKRCVPRSWLKLSMRWANFRRVASKLAPSVSEKPLRYCAESSVDRLKSARRLTSFSASHW